MPDVCKCCRGLGNKRVDYRQRARAAPRAESCRASAPTPGPSGCGVTRSISELALVLELAQDREVFSLAHRWNHARLRASLASTLKLSKHLFLMGTCPTCVVQSVAQLRVFEPQSRCIRCLGNAKTMRRQRCNTQHPREAEKRGSPVCSVPVKPPTASSPEQCPNIGTISEDEEEIYAPNCLI